MDSENAPGPSPFLQLPSEIRLEIYYYLLEDSVPCKDCFQKQVASLSIPHSPVAQVNKQVRGETMHVICTSEGSIVEIDVKRWPASWRNWTTTAGSMKFTEQFIGRIRKFMITGLQPCGGLWGPGHTKVFVNLDGYNLGAKECTKFETGTNECVSDIEHEAAYGEIRELLDWHRATTGGRIMTKALFLSLVDAARGETSSGRTCGTVDLALGIGNTPIAEENRTCGT